MRELYEKEIFRLSPEEKVIRLLQDENELVRAKACDSLKNSFSIDILPLLLDLAKHDKSDLVRGNASSSIAYVVLNTNQSKNTYIDFLYNLVEKENIKWVKLHLYKALYQLGEIVFLYKLLDELNNRKIKGREAVVYLLGEIATDENRDIIKTALLQAVKEERTVLVKSVIEKVINNL